MTAAREDIVPTADQAETAVLIGASAGDPQAKGGIGAGIRNGAIVVALSLVILEILLRILGVNHPVLYEHDPDVGYRVKPNQHVTYLFNTIAINAHGVRDPRPLETRDPAKRRVVCLGDSVTWGGIYIRQEDLFTSIAERKLGNVEVINAGVNGYSATQMARLYEKYLTALEPDLVVVCAIPRDFERPPVMELGPDDVGFPDQPPVCAVTEAMRIAWTTAAKRIGWDGRDRSVLARSSAIRAQEANESAIIELSRKLAPKTRLMIALLPSRFTRTQLLDARLTVRSLQDAGIQLAYLGADARLNEADYVDLVHYNAEGHRKIGASLAIAIYDGTSPDATAEVSPSLDPDLIPTPNRRGRYSD